MTTFVERHPGLVGKCVYARPTLVGTFHNQHIEECQYTEEFIDATQIDKEIVKEAIDKVHKRLDAAIDDENSWIQGETRKDIVEYALFGLQKELGL